MKLFLQKNAKFWSAVGSAPRPQYLQRLGALPPDPQSPAAAGGSASRFPNTLPHCEFLATRRKNAEEKMGLRYLELIGSALAQ